MTESCSRLKAPAIALGLALFGAALAAGPGLADTNTAGADGLDTSSQDDASGAWPAGGGHANSGLGATGRVRITRTA